MARWRNQIKRLIQGREGGPSVIRWLLGYYKFAWVLLCHHLAVTACQIVFAAHLRERWESFQCACTLFVVAAQHSRHSSARWLFHRVAVTAAPSPVLRNVLLALISKTGLLARLQAPAHPLIFITNITIFLKLVDSLANPLLKLLHWVFWDEFSRAILSNFFFEHWELPSVILSGKLLLQAANKHILEVIVMICAVFYFKRAKLVYCTAGRAERVLRHSWYATRSHLFVPANVPVQRRVSLHHGGFESSMLLTFFFVWSLPKIKIFYLYY